MLTNTFKRECKAIRKKGQFTLDFVKESFQAVLADPFADSEPMSGDFKGWRRAKFKRLRIMYVVCHECRENGHQQYNRCQDCDMVPDGNRLVIFTAIRDRDKAYDRK